ncbi:ComEC/Rec2 family competence protein, partial [Patescibacteria group bacterium]
KITIPYLSKNILWPKQPLSDSLKKNINNASVVTQLVYNNAEFLLTGDINKSVEDKLSEIWQNSLESDILKAGHHGSKNSNSQNFIQKVNPEISVISAGVDNSYGHPHQDTLDRFKQTLIYRTDKHGDIRMITNGFELNVERD